MIALLQDLRFALRHLRRSPGFAVTAVLVLALGIAANVIVLGVVQTMLLEPIDVPQGKRVVTFGPRPSAYPAFSYPEIRDVRDGSTVFAGVAAVAVSVFGLDANGSSEPLWGSEVSGQYFEVMGIKPFLGRLLTPADDDHPGASQAAVLSWPEWKGHFNADPDVVGKTVRIDKLPYTIVGVTPEGFYGSEKFLQPEIFLPMANQASLDGVSWLEDRNSKGASPVFPIARLKDGVTVEQAQAELHTIAARVRKQHPREEENVDFWLAPPGLIGNFVRKAARGFLVGILSLAGIVLLAACANLGSLFAARTADRAREIAIRVAIGSSRWRIVRQVLMEAVVIAILGGLCASALAWMALNGLAQWHPPSDYPIRFQLHPQPSLILVALLISLAAGILFGTLPLRQIFKAQPSDAIKSGNSTASTGRRWALRDILLAAQIALCCITVTAAFVSLRGLSKAFTTDIGIQPANATLTKFDLSQAAYSSRAAEQFQRQLQQRVQQLPGVAAVGYASGTPLSDPVTTPVFQKQTTDFRPSTAAFDTYFYNVSPGYFAAAGTPLLAGRDMRFADTATTPLVAVVNQQFARSMFHLDASHASDAVGRYFRNHDGNLVQTIGLVQDGKYFLLGEDPQEAVYYSMLQQPGTGTSLVVRGRPGLSRDAAADLAIAVRKLIHDLDAAVPIRSSGTWDSQLAFSFFPAQVATVALGIFGAFGLLLSITGTFGLASYTVTKRMRELSIRVALGAQGKQILSAALGRMLKLMAAGAAAGLGLGIATGRLLSHIVYQATAQDPLVLVTVVVIILLTGMLSIAGPVRRALHADPSELLREQ